MKLIVTAMLICLLTQAGFFAIRDGVSSIATIFDRCAEIALLLMVAGTLFFFSRHPRISMSIFSVCAVVIGLNLEQHTDDHSVSGILARNLLTIVFLIVAALGTSSFNGDKQTS